MKKAGNESEVIEEIIALLHKSKEYLNTGYEDEAVIMLHEARAVANEAENLSPKLKDECIETISRIIENI